MLCWRSPGWGMRFSGQQSLWRDVSTACTIPFPSSAGTRRFVNSFKASRVSECDIRPNPGNLCGNHWKPKARCARLRGYQRDRTQRRHPACRGQHGGDRPGETYTPRCRHHRASATKYIAGMGPRSGVWVVDSGRFDWSNGKFPEFTEPDPSYHGLQYWDAFGAVPEVGNVASSARPGSSFFVISERH